AAGGRSGSYRAWFGRRLRRLVKPVPILLAVWAAVVPLLILAGYPAGTIVSLINLVLDPLWFLLVFIGLTALTPIVVRAVRRWGAGAAVLPVAVTALVDLARFGLDAPQWIGWINVASAWLVPFTLGVAWAQGSFTPRPPASGQARNLPGRDERSPRRPALTSDQVRSHLAPWALLVGGGAAAVALVLAGGYPASMVGVPGQAVSNLSPPTLASVAFGLAQCGAALLLRGPLTRLMRRPVLWAGVAMMNLSAMTVFLWHQSALLGVSTLVTRVTDRVPGLLDAPDHPGWLAHRLTWIPVFAAVLAGMWSLAHRFERRIRFQPTSRPVRLTKRSDVPEGAFGTRRTTTGCTEH
ncbi:acyltransferase family protein, partial [Spirillospora sp. NPDC049652]